MKRITDSQVIKHTDGESHEQIYCFGHLWGPAYFKRGSKDYEEYISIVRKLKAYEDTGLEPGEIAELKERGEAQKMFKPNPNIYCCPACGEKITPMWDYCPWCGQHVIDN